MSIFGNSGERRAEMRGKKGKGKGGAGQNPTSGFDQGRTDVESAAAAVAAGPLNLSSPAAAVQGDSIWGSAAVFRVSRSFCQSQQQHNAIHSRKRFYPASAGSHEAHRAPRRRPLRVEREHAPPPNPRRFYLMHKDTFSSFTSDETSGQEAEQTPPLSAAACRHFQK